MAESFFEKHRVTVDALLRSMAPDALEMVPAIQSRLTEGDREAISQGMNTIRRIIRALADRVFPAQSEPVQYDGQPMKVDDASYLNRITAFLQTNCQSADRRVRLRNTARDLNTRASAGSHDDVTTSEARALFLAAYLFCGEILELAPVTPPTD